jgi:diguanylate cyclase (GGDEF)-like protein
MSPGGNTLEMMINHPQRIDHAPLRMGEGLAGQVAKSGEAMIVEDYQNPAILPPGLRPILDVKIGRAMGVPLKVGGKVIGVLTVQDYDPGRFTEDEVKVVSLFADQAALAIDKARLYAEVQRLATVDDVTGLLNRRGLWEFGRREFERARRFNRPLIAIFLDIDHFKLVNDTYGHATGDQVLRMLGERLKANTREVDLVARYGGEEFIVLLPEVDIHTASQVAERLRRSAVDVPMVTDQGNVVISLSLGVVQIREDTHDLAMLIDLADQAMFAAKQNGRNRVEVRGLDQVFLTGN